MQQSQFSSQACCTSGLISQVGKALTAPTFPQATMHTMSQVEELRLALLVSDGALAHLAALLQHEEEWMRTTAAACLGNLAACRSDFKNAQPQVKASDCVHFQLPCTLVAASGCSAQLCTSGLV